MREQSRRPQFGTRIEVLAADKGIARVAAIMAVPRLLHEGGFVAADMLSSLGLDPATFDQPDRTISYVDAGRILQRSAEITECAHFGLAVGQHNTIESLAVLGEVMLRSSSVHAALRSMVLHMHLQTRGGMPTHTIENENATFGYAIYQRAMPGTTHVYDLAMAYGFNILRALCGPSWSPIEASFSHNKPDDLTPYRKFFGVPLRFDAERTAIVFNKSWLSRVPPLANARMHRDLQRRIAAQELRQPDTLAEQIRRALRTMVVTGGATESQISELFSVPARTLRRLLSTEGTTFRALLDETHFEVARQLLSYSEMPTVEIAATLGYSDSTAFTRAFRRWSSLPPAAWRVKFRRAEGGLGMAERAWDE